MPLLEIKEILGFEVKDEMLYGEKDGYYFSLTTLFYGYPMDGLLIVFAQSLDKESLKIIQKETGLACFLRTMHLKNDALFVGFPVKDQNSEATTESLYMEAIDKILSTFMKLSLKQPESCVICDQDHEGLTAPKHLLNYYYYVPFHEACAKKPEPKPKTVKPGPKLDPHNLVLSIVLAIIGALIGYLPILIYAIINGGISSLVFVIVPIFSFWGYKLGRAPRKNYMTYIIIITCITLVVILDVLVGWLFQATAAQIMEVLLDDVFCVVIGILLAWIIIVPKE